MGTRGPIKAGVAKGLPGLMRSGLVSIGFVDGEKTPKTYVFRFCFLNKLVFDLCESLSHLILMGGCSPPPGLPGQGRWRGKSNTSRVNCLTPARLSPRKGTSSHTEMLAGSLPEDIRDLIQRSMPPCEWYLQGGRCKRGSRCPRRHQELEHTFQSALCKQIVCEEQAW